MRTRYGFEGFETRGVGGGQAWSVTPGSMQKRAVFVVAVGLFALPMAAAAETYKDVL
jgi:hypothetical protein